MISEIFLYQIECYACDKKEIIHSTLHIRPQIWEFKERWVKIDHVQWSARYNEHTRYFCEMCYLKLAASEVKKLRGVSWVNPLKDKEDDDSE